MEDVLIYVGTQLVHIIVDVVVGTTSLLMESPARKKHHRVRIFNINHTLTRHFGSMLLVKHAKGVYVALVPRFFTDIDREMACEDRRVISI